MIPKLKVKDFLTDRIVLDICDFLGKTEEELTQVVDSLNSKADSYISFRLGKHLNKLDDEKWKILKENYMFWKLYEMANVSEDFPVKEKKKELEELLKTVIDAEATKYNKKGVIVI